MTEEKTSKELEDKWRGGDLEAFDLLYERYKKPLLNFIYRLLGNFSETWDIFQETFLRAYQTTCRKTKPDAEFSTWIYTIARNLCYNEIKRRKRYTLFSLLMFKEEKENVIVNGTMGFLQTLERTEAANELKKAISKLSPKHREVVILSVYNEFSCEKIADILECSVGTVKSRMFYARQLLKKILK